MTHEPQPVQAVAADAARVAPLPAAAAALELDGGEVIQLSLKPSLWYIPIVSLRWLAGGAILAPGLLVAAQAGWTPWLPLAFQAVIAAVGLRLTVATLQWASRLYVLTNRRVIRFKGVLNVDVREALLARIREVRLERPSYQVSLRLGSIVIAPSDERKSDVAWTFLARAEEIHEILTRAIRKAQLGH